MADQGFAKMDDDKQRIIASDGGKESNITNNNSQDMSKIGKKGAKAQSSESKAKGGRNSHRDSE